MADDADIAGAIADRELERRLAAARVPVAAGVSGECASCGEVMPRLIGGRCGYCRDGRR